MLLLCMTSFLFNALQSDFYHHSFPGDTGVSDLFEKLISFLLLLSSIACNPRLPSLHKLSSFLHFMALCFSSPYAFPSYPMCCDHF